MKTLQVIMAHREAQETFDRHTDAWLSLGMDMLAFFPEDAPIDTGFDTFAYGHACHHGPHSIERFRNLLYYLETTKHDEFYIQEYDSFSLQLPFLLQRRGTINLWSNLFETAETKWFGTGFCHPPLHFDRTCLERLVAASGLVSDHAERSFWDRWLGLVCNMGGIQMHKLEGFSQNTIEPNQIQDAVAAAKSGARHFHGVKTKECFDAIMEAVNGPR